MPALKHGFIITTPGLDKVVGPPVLRSALLDGKGCSFLIADGKGLKAEGRFLGKASDASEVLRDFPRGTILHSGGLGVTFKVAKKGLIVPA